MFFGSFFVLQGTCTNVGTLRYLCYQYRSSTVKHLREPWQLFLGRRRGVGGPDRVLADVDPAWPPLSYHWASSFDLLVVDNLLHV